MSTGPRLRQVALVARDIEVVAGRLRQVLGSHEVFVDPGVAAFGLRNALFAVGDTFVEVVTPIEPGTTAGRYLDRRNGDGGYMAIFQVPDIVEARRRVGELGVRVVWSADHHDVAGTHLHPKDVPGAIVSLDWADPPTSWRWAGPTWTGGAPPHDDAGIVGLTVEVDDPHGVASRWAAVLGLPAPADGTTTVVLGSARQVLSFTQLASGRGEGITAISFAGLAGPGGLVGGVDLDLQEA